MKSTARTVRPASNTEGTILGEGAGLDGLLVPREGKELPADTQRGCQREAGISEAFHGFVPQAALPTGPTEGPPSGLRAPQTCR